jgi:hypothetical protein
LRSPSHRPRDRIHAIANARVVGLTVPDRRALAYAARGVRWTTSRFCVSSLRGSDRPCRFGRHPDVRIGHIGEVDAGGGGVIERDFRKRDEEKLAHASG